MSSIKLNSSQTIEEEREIVDTKISLNFSRISALINPEVLDQSELEEEIFTCRIK